MYKVVAESRARVYPDQTWIRYIFIMRSWLQTFRVTPVSDKLNRAFSCYLFLNPRSTIVRERNALAKGEEEEKEKEKEKVLLVDLCVR